MIILAVVSAVVVVESKNFSTCIPPVSEDLFSLKLSSKYTYDIGIDQSSSCTGIAIRSTDKDIKVLIDVRRDCGDKPTFYRELKGILRGCIAGHKIREFTCEDPVPTKGKKYSSTVLLELRGRVSEWVESIPELENAHADSLYPQTWKSFIVDKSKGKNRSNNKFCIADDICDKVPEFRKYMNVYAPSTYDAFDAYGILDGYGMYAYTEDNLPLICGKIEKQHRAFVGFRYLPLEKLRDGSINDFMGNAVTIFKPKFLMFNERYNYFTNIRMASSNHDCSFTIVPDEQLEVLKWKYDIEPQEDYVLVAWIFNFSHYPQATKTSLKNFFEMNEEVMQC